MDKYQILKQYFGHTSFRPGQEELIDSLLRGRDALGIMPTGGGKSMCYQVPALLLPGITLVISPLISLMKDQVMALKQAGIPAAYLNSSLTPEQLGTVYRRLRSGAYKIVYVAPERLCTDRFQEAIGQLDLSLVAVDEAHCISQWGQDFRPSYLEIPDFLDALPHRPPVGAFTATATGEVRRDILRMLRLREPHTVVTGFDRPNLYFDVQSMRESDKPAALRRLLFSREGKSGIVYCSTRAKVERVCADLTLYGFSATRYHAGLEEAERRHNQDEFRFDRAQIMVATNAFGMGIDKSNVSFVIHYNMPKSLEAYYQEAGRAGRDGSPADCILLFSQSDIRTARFLIQNGGDNQALTPEEQARLQARDYRRLEAMVDYSHAAECLRGRILDYFGQSHPPVCGSCGNCRAHYDLQDITTQAQMILSCVKRIETHLGYFLGTGKIVKVLRGSRDQQLLSLGLDGLSTYGLMREYTEAQVTEYIDHLLSHGYLYAGSAHGELTLTAKAPEVLFRGGRVQLPVKRPEETEAPRRDLPGAISEPDEALFAELKQVRFRLARKAGVPAYVVFSNATLADMSARRPRSFGELLEVNGVGRKKAEKYGDAFLEAIAKFEIG